MELQENKDENIKIATISIFTEFLHQFYNFDERTLQRVHRLGQFKRGKIRDVLARFSNFKDKLTVLEMKEKIKKMWHTLIGRPSL